MLTLSYSKKQITENFKRGRSVLRNVKNLQTPVFEFRHSFTDTIVLDCAFVKITDDIVLYHLISDA
jgi:hypothetical protein